MIPIHLLEKPGSQCFVMSIKDGQTTGHLFYEAICCMSFRVPFCSCVFQSFQYCDYLACGRESLSQCFWYVCSVRACLDLSVSSSSWGLERAAVCDCGTPWTFLLSFFQRGIHYCSYFCLKKPQIVVNRQNRFVEAILTSTHNLCFEQKYEKYQNFYLKIFKFLW